MSMGALLKVIEERDEARQEVRDLTAQAKAAAIAPARFRRITPRTKVTAPCVLALVGNAVDSEGPRWGEKEEWVATICHNDIEVNKVKNLYTHFLPIEFPEVRQ